MNVRICGALLVVTALVTAVSAGARVSAGADQSTTVETLNAISFNAGLYALGGAARFISGITLLAAALTLPLIWAKSRRRGWSPVRGLFAVSGGFTAVSGVLAVTLAMSSPAALLLVSGPDGGGWIESVLQARWMTGKIGFALAGLALLSVARSLWTADGARRWAAPASAIIGAAMQFIWVDSATAVHPVVGVAFFLWLLAAGILLLTGRVPDSSPPAPDHAARSRFRRRGT